MPGRASLVLLGSALALCFVLSADSLAGDARKAKTKAKPHLDFKRTYGAALEEARIRNLPVFVSRHKDF